MKVSAVLNPLLHPRWRIFEIIRGAVYCFSPRFFTRIQDEKTDFAKSLGTITPTEAVVMHPRDVQSFVAV